MRVAVIGDCTLDVTVRPSAQLRPGGDVPASVELGPGGQGANVAVQLARLGVSVSLAAPVADDVAGSILRSSLAAKKVRLHALAAARSATVVALLDPSGERAMLSDRVTLDPGAATRACAGADWVHCSAYPLADDATGDALASSLGGLAASARVSVAGGSLPPDPALVARVQARVAASDASLLIFGRDEASALLGTRIESLAAGAAALQATFPGTWAIVTGGAEGSAAAGRAEALSVPGRSVETVDATGAGDAYTAGLIAALLHEEWPPSAGAMQRAMLAATELGAKAAGVLGAQGLP